MIEKLLITLLGVTGLEVGDAAPDFSATDVDGKKVVLSEMVKEGPVVLAFFPKAFTPG
jgi:peroxiredoxin